MATCIWKGDAPAVAKVMTMTPANVEVDDVFTLTCGGESISFTATAATVANVCTGLTALWNASTLPEHAEITATDSTTHITMTCDTAGVDFTVVPTETEGGGNDTQTFTAATPTAAAGPNVWSCADNWSGGAVPVNADDVILEHINVDILYGLAQSAVTLDSLTIKASYTGKLGLPERHPASGSAAAYDEYRETYLEISASVVTINEGEGDGSGRLKLDTGASDSQRIVYGTGNRAEQHVPALLLKGTHVGTSLEMHDGDVGICYFGDESGNLDDVWIGPTSSARLYIGSGVTVTAGGILNVYGGQVVSESNLIAPTVTAGTLTLIGDATVTTMTVDGGRVDYKSSGTITTLDCHGEIDFRGSPQTRTVTNATFYAGSSVDDPYGTVTWTNGCDLSDCSPQTMRFNVAPNLTWTPTAI